ncbi:MAG: ParA family protein [Thermoplasmata archaeon]|nr:ParA family protein [Thermoplasmata archaeon]
MVKKITIVNQKGGVGKTTTAVNLSASLAVLGKKTLLIDTDPQGNATSGLGFVKHELKFTIYEVLTGQCDIEEAILNTDIEDLHLIGANVNLAGATVELVDVPDREFILKNKLRKVEDDYEYILIDSPPSLGLITINNLVASDSVLIPLQCEYYALEGMSELLDTIYLVQKNLNPHLKLEGILMTMFDRRTNLSKQVVEEVRSYFGEKVYKTVIPRNVKLGEAPSFGKPVVLYAPSASGAQAYLELAKEVIAHGEE